MLIIRSAPLLLPIGNFGGTQIQERHPARDIGIPPGGDALEALLPSATNKTCSSICVLSNPLGVLAQDLVALHKASDEVPVDSNGRQ